MKPIESLGLWAEQAIRLADDGYRIWQMQFDTQHLDGFHTWLCALGKPEVEIVTFDESVENTVLKYNLPSR